jgi:hypothetical protein
MVKDLLPIEIIDLLKMQKKIICWSLWQRRLQKEKEKKKGQLHRVFEESFDAKPIYNQKFFMQKFNYIHHNPVSGKWNLVNDYTDYEHRSASFYDLNIVKSYQPFDFRVL